MNEDFFLAKPLDRLIRWFRFKSLLKEIKPGSVVCDIGCGKDLKFLRLLAPIIKKGVGIDKSCEDLEEYNLQRVKLKIDGKLPLDNDSVDYVTMSAVLEHLDKPEEILKECYRILRSEGKIILTTPTPKAKPVLEFLAFRLKIIDAEEIKDHKNYFNSQELKEILCKAGFSLQNISVDVFEFGFNNISVAIK